MKPAKDLERYKGDFPHQGHRFGADMNCLLCDVSWESHQADPRPCEVVLAECQAKIAQLELLWDKHFTAEGIEKTQARVHKGMCRALNQVKARLCEVVELKEE